MDLKEIYESLEETEKFILKNLKLINIILQTKGKYIFKKKDLQKIFYEISKHYKKIFEELKFEEYEKGHYSEILDNTIEDLINLELVCKDYNLTKKGKIIVEYYIK